ncbi:hypothetical protein AS594_39145 [Streptomyces agglomeratus]|uniref:Uncharacterized protein n=1 Tax=Streptomyces agglomeratus TaxID=285458 RepID=A0A1E5NZ10_9ACTN|nr:hypothetical protein [Streptomyces agglomeratus]OEJ21555.1 hypothetical protein AS594_39145 [Streptomyces agglomeratus]
MTNDEKPKLWESTPDRQQRNKDLYVLLGMMVRTAANVELMLQAIALNLVESPYAMQLVAGDSASRAAETIRRVIAANPRLSSDAGVDLSALLSESEALFRRRNGYVHGYWSASADPDGEQSLSTGRFRRSGDIEQSPLDADDLKELVSGLNGLDAKFRKWLVAWVSDGHQGSTT